MRVTITAPDLDAAETGMRCYMRHTDERMGAFSVSASTDSGGVHVEFNVTKSGVAIRVQREK